MAKIGLKINGVTIEFSDLVNNDVDNKLLMGLKFCIGSGKTQGYSLHKIYISSASDQHVMPSRHAQKKAVDISRINGIKIIQGYPNNPMVKAIVDNIQTTFESYFFRRENFGPLFKKKFGKPHSVSGHKDHIHLSVY